MTKTCQKWRKIWSKLHYLETVLFDNKTIINRKWNVHYDWNFAIRSYKVCFNWSMDYFFAPQSIYCQKMTKTSQKWRKIWSKLHYLETGLFGNKTIINRKWNVHYGWNFVIRSLKVCFNWSMDYVFAPQSI